MTYLFTVVSLFLGSFLAATIIPFSSEILFLTALKASVVPGVTLVITAGLGNTLGGLTGYWLGLAGRWEWLEKYFKLSKPKIESYQKITSAYGYWLALFCWLPFIGDLLCVVLGFFRLRFWPVTVLMFAGKLTRYALIALIFS